MLNVQQTVLLYLICVIKSKRVAYVEVKAYNIQHKKFGWSKVIYVYMLCSMFKCCSK